MRAFAAAEILCIRRAGEERSHGSGINDARKNHPDRISDVSGWKKWTDRVLRQPRMESRELHDALKASAKAKGRVMHDLADASVFVWAHP